MSNIKEALAKWDAADELLQEKVDKCVTKDEWVVIDKVIATQTANTLEYTGISIEVPKNKVVLVCVENRYSSYAPVKTVIAVSDTDATGHRIVAEGVSRCSCIYSPTYDNYVLHIWSSHAGTGNNTVVVKYNFI